MISRCIVCRQGITRTHRRARCTDRARGFLTPHPAILPPRVPRENFRSIQPETRCCLRFNKQFGRNRDSRERTTLRIQGFRANPRVQNAISITIGKGEQQQEGVGGGGKARSVCSKWEPSKNTWPLLRLRAAALRRSGKRATARRFSRRRGAGDPKGVNFQTRGH